MLYLIIAAAVCLLDQLLKLWVTMNIEPGGVVRLIPGIIHLTYTENTGAAFSILSGYTWLLSLISLAAVVLIAVLILKKDLPVWEKVSLALVMGGAIGNLIDRVLLGHVVDMFEVEFTNYAVFNLADAFIDVGAGLFVLLYLIRTIREEKAKKAAADDNRNEPETGEGDGNGNEMG